MVNDLSLIELGPTVDLGLSLTAILEGIALDPDEKHAFLARPLSILQVDLNTLAVEREIDVENMGGRYEALAFPPDGDLLYVVSRQNQFGVLDLETGQTVKLIEKVGKSEFFIHPLPGGLAWVGGRDLVLLDVTREEILRHLDMPEAWHFALSPDGGTIAIVTRFTPALGELLLVDAGSLEILWRTTLEEDPGRLAVATGFSLSGDQIYVVQGPIIDGTEWSFVVVDAEDGTVTREMTIARGCSSTFCEGVASPAALSADGRYLAVSIGLGTYLIDRTLHLPVARTPHSIYCCNLAASRNANRFYVSGFFTGTLSSFTVTR